MVVNAEKILKKFSELPWRSAGWVAAGGFVLASMAANLATYILMPKFEVAKIPTPAAAGNFGEQFASAESLGEQDLKQIYDRNIFNRDGELGDQKPVATEGEEDEPSDKAVPTELPVTLLGVIYGGTPFNGLATIQNTQKNKINSFIVGDTLLRDAKITEIRRTRVYITRAGRLEYLELQQKELVRSSRKKKSKAPSKKPGISPIAKGPALKNYKEPGFEREGAKMVVSESFKQNLIGADLTKVLQDAKATPNMVDGQVKGFRLTRIREGSVYQKAGFQNDDVVEEINGVPLNNAGAAIRLLNSLRSETEIEILVTRDGSTFPMDITIQ